MAIFNNSDSPNQSTKPDSSTTIITVGSSIKGEMNLTCNLYVDGELEGTINSQNEVKIGKHGHVKGDIITKRLVIHGCVEGSINADRVEIRADGRVSGTIESAELIIESKGIFEGNSVVKDIKPIQAPKKIQIDKA
ncbi:MAG: polymer-forming cytoskeletal protein [Sulfurimonas sp.]|nr:polymer-forming cytoskeletal protein [Sulfurimonas sp.]